MAGTIVVRGSTRRGSFGAAGTVYGFGRGPEEGKVDGDAALSGKSDDEAKVGRAGAGAGSDGKLFGEEVHRERAGAG